MTAQRTEQKGELLAQQASSPGNPEIGVTCRRSLRQIEDVSRLVLSTEHTSSHTRPDCNDTSQQTVNHASTQVGRYKGVVNLSVPADEVTSPSQLASRLFFPCLISKPCQKPRMQRMAGRFAARQ